MDNSNKPNLLQNKWYALFSGIIFILSGLIIIRMPAESAVAFLIYFAIMQLVLGTIGIFSYFKTDKENRTFLQLISSIFSILVGLLLLCEPYAPILLGVFMPYLIGGWAMAYGILQFYLCFKMKDKVKWLLLVSGIFAILYSIFMFMHPLAGAYITVEAAGFYFVFSGVMSVVVFFMLLFKKDDGSGSGTLN